MSDEGEYYDQIYHAVGVANAPDDYSKERKRRVRMGMQLTREQQLEMPASLARTLDVEGRPLDNSHHPGTMPGRCKKGWYDERDRSYHILFQLKKNEDGTAVKKNIDDGILNDVSLTTLEEYARPTDFVLNGPSQAVQTQAKKALEHPARAVIWAVAVCYKGARPGTSIRKENPASIHAAAVLAAWGEDSQSLVDVVDASCSHLNCEQCRGVMASAQAPESKYDAAQTQQQPAAPMDTSPTGQSPPDAAAPVPANQPVAQPQQQQPVQEVDLAAAINKSNLSAAEKAVLVQQLQNGKSVVSDVSDILKHSNIPRDVKEKLMAKLSPPPAKDKEPEANTNKKLCRHGREGCDAAVCNGEISTSPKPPTETQLPWPQSETTDMVDENDTRTPIERALERITAHIGKTDTQSKANVFHTLIPLIDMMKLAGVRDIGGQKLSVALLGQLARDDPQDFKTKMKALYDNALAPARNGEAEKVSRASAGSEPNSGDGYTLHCNDVEQLNKAKRFLAAVSVNPSPAHRRQQMASDSSSSSVSHTFASASSGTLASNGNAAAMAAAAIPTTVLAKQRAASRGLFELDDMSEVMRRGFTKEQTLKALVYAKQQDDVMKDLEGSPLLHFGAFSGTMTVSNSALAQICAGPKAVTVQAGLVGAIGEMLLCCATANKEQSSVHHAMGALRDPDIANLVVI